MTVIKVEEDLPATHNLVELQAECEAIDPTAIVQHVGAGEIRKGNQVTVIDEHFEITFDDDTKSQQLIDAVKNHVRTEDPKVVAEQVEAERIYSILKKSNTFKTDFGL